MYSNPTTNDRSVMQHNKEPTDFITMAMIGAVDRITEHFDDERQRETVGSLWKLSLAQYQSIRYIAEFRLGGHIRFVPNSQLDQLNRGGTLIAINFDKDDQEDAVLTLKMYSKQPNKICRYRFSDCTFFQKLTEHQRAMFNYAEEDF